MTQPLQKNPTDRSLVMWLIFSAISCGLYPLFALSNISSELNAAASQRDGRKTFDGALAILLGVPTLGILPLCWWHTTCQRIGDELNARGYGTTFGSDTFWGWGFFGALLFGLGPLIFLHKLCEAVNRLNEDYNRHGCEYPVPGGNGARRAPSPRSAATNLPETAADESSKAVPYKAPRETAQPNATPTKGRNGADEGRFAPPANWKTPSAQNSSGAVASSKSASTPPPHSPPAPPPRSSPTPSPTPPPAPAPSPLSANPPPILPDDNPYATTSLTCEKGHSNPPGALYCATCGAALLSRCPECGHIIPSSAAFCTRCGTEVKSFAALAAAADRLDALAKANDWATLQTEAAALPEAPRLPGGKGQEILDRIRKAKASAEAALVECDRDEHIAAEAAADGDYARAEMALSASLKRFPGRADIEARRRAMADYRQLASQFDAAFQSADTDALSKLVASMRRAGMPAGELARFESRLEARKRECLKAGAALEAEVSKAVQEIRVADAFATVRRHAATTAHSLAAGAARRLAVRLGPAEKPLASIAASLARNDIDGARAALRGIPADALVPVEATAIAHRIEMAAARLAAADAYRGAFRHALAAGALTDALPQAEKSLSPGIRGQVPGETRAEIAGLASRIAAAAKQFDAAISRGNEKPAAQCLDALRSLDVPEKGLARQNAAIADLRGRIGALREDLDGQWRGCFHQLDVTRALAILDDASSSSPLADVRDHAADLAKWIREDYILDSLVTSIRQEEFSDAIEKAQRLVPDECRLRTEDIDAMLRTLRARRHAARVGAVRALLAVAAVIAVVAGGIVGLAKWQNAQSIKEAHRAFANRLLADIDGLWTPLAQSRARERLAEQYRAGTDARNAALEHIAHGRYAKAIPLLLDAKESLRAACLEAEEAACAEALQSVRDALARHDWEAARKAGGTAREFAETGLRLARGNARANNLTDADAGIPAWEARLKDAEDLILDATTSPLLQEARDALARKAWKAAFDLAGDVQSKDRDNAEAKRLAKEAFSHFRPQASYLYDFDGAPADLDAFSSADGGPHGLPQTIVLSPGERRPAQNIRLVRDGVEYVAALPALKGDWDGIRTINVKIRWSPAPGSTRSIPISSPVPVEAFSTMVFRWCPPGWTTVGSPGNEPGRPRYSRTLKVSQANGITEISGPEGDETPRSVEIADGFWLSETEVTLVQWEYVMGTTLTDQTRKAIEENGWAEKGTDPATMHGDQALFLPMYFVDCSEAEAFCRRLTEIERAAERLLAGFAYVLPTGDQWEYACRAGSGSGLPDGTPIDIAGYANAPALDALAWYAGNSCHEFEGIGWPTSSWPERQYDGERGAPRKVATRKANAWGLCDMLGNLWEWCRDDAADDEQASGGVVAWGKYDLMYGAYAYEMRSPVHERGWARLQRGGAWNSRAADVRPARRLWRKASLRSPDAGFRVALVRESPEARWDALPSAAPFVEAARQAAKDRNWAACFESVSRALSVDVRHEEARELRDKALRHFHPVAELMPTIDGQAVGDGFTFLLESDNFFRSLRRPLRIDVTPGLKDDQRFKEFVAICGKRRYTALVPVSGADWDGIRQCPVSLQYSPEAGFRHTVPIPGSRRPIELAWCPFARPLLGSPPEEPGRDADESFRSPLLNGFWMATTEVTQGQWKALMGRSLDDQTRLAFEDPAEYPFSDKPQTMREYLGATPDTMPFDRRGDEDDDVPVYFVSWQEAMEFCRRLTAAERAAGRLPEGFAYALPTENQWEYACRAGSTTTLPDGTPLSILGAHNAPALDPVAWYGGNSSVDFSGRGWITDEWREKQYPGGHAAPRRVAGKRANAWGIYDMLGNVCEWCFDELGYKSAVDAFRGRALRGGAWNSEARFVRPAARDWHYAGWRSSNIGFRVALVAESQNPFSWNRFAEIAGTTQK